MTPQKGQRLGGRGKPPEPTSTRTDPPAPTAPGTVEETPVEAPAGNGQTEHPAAPVRARKKAQVPGQIEPRLKAFWRTNLQNAARKLAVDRARVLESEDAWVDTVADARDAGVPANVILAAAADADVEVPE